MIEECREGEWELEEISAEGREKAGLRHYLKQSQGDGLSVQLGTTIHQVREGGERKSSNKHVTPKITTTDNTLRITKGTEMISFSSKHDFMSQTNS